MRKSQKKQVSSKLMHYVNGHQPELPLKKQVQSKSSALIVDERPQPAFHPKVPAIVEGDFSKISSSYVLENDRLRVKSILYKKPEKGGQLEGRKQSEENSDNSSCSRIDLIREITKLEYLEKKGYLKPQEQQRLTELRQFCGSQIKQIPRPPFPETNLCQNGNHLLQSEQAAFFEMGSENRNPNWEPVYSDPQRAKQVGLGLKPNGYEYGQNNSCYEDCQAEPHSYYLQPPHGQYYQRSW